MTDRSAPPSSPPQVPPAPAKPSKTPRIPRGKNQPAPSTGEGDTAVRGGLAERVQAKLASAADEHRASAEAPLTQPKAPARGRGPRRARLRLTRIDPWSVMKTAFLLSIAFGVVTVVSVAMVWQVLQSAGVWDSINSTVQEVLGESEAADFDVQDYVGTSRVLGFTMLVAAVDVILLTAIATLGAFLYNMAAALLGGIEVTLAEDN